MINKLIDGVCRAIYNEFGEEYHIYTEKIEQRFTRPCFFAEVTDSSMELFRGDRYYMKNKVLVTYYPCYKDKNANMAKTAVRLSLCLNEIIVDDAPLMGLNCKQSFEKDSLAACAEYSFFVRLKGEKENCELMEEYTLNLSEGNEKNE